MNVVRNICLVWVATGVAAVTFAALCAACTVIGHRSAERHLANTVEQWLEQQELTP